MRKDKNYIIEMRSKGMSYDAIARETGVSKSTLSKWFKNDSISDSVKKTLQNKNYEESRHRIMNLNKTRGNLLNVYYEQAENEALNALKVFSNNTLFVFGVAAYWGEGDKASKNGFRISNSDPEFIRLFIKFMINICKVEKQKIRLYLMIYADSDPTKVLDYWSKKVGLDQGYFAKPYVLKGRHKKKKLPFGTCIASCSSSYLKRKMNVWLKELYQVL